MFLISHKYALWSSLPVTKLNASRGFQLIQLFLKLVTALWTGTLVRMSYKTIELSDPVLATMFVSV